MAASTIVVEPLSGALGATIRGVDLAALDDAAFDRIYQVFLDHHVFSSAAKR